VTPLNSPQPSNNTPHYYSSSLPRHESSRSGASETLTPACYKRTRRVSVSPSELARLSDQNQDLLQKLQDLEEESESADKAGKRRLNKLEKDISVLRQELEEARAHTTALEEHNAVLQRSNVEATTRKERGNLGRGKQDDQATIRAPDFAPSGTVVFPPNFQRRVISNASILDPSTPKSALQELVNQDATPYQEWPRTPSEISRASSPKSEVDAREHALVSQLLLKVRELEEANAQISQNQRETTTKLHSAKLEAETIRRVYEYLDDSNTDIDLQAEEASPSPFPSSSVDPKMTDITPTLSNFVFPAVDHQTIRFRSLRRTIDGDVRRSAFEGGIRPDMHSTTHGTTKAPRRRPVAGLFDNPPRASFASASSAFTHLEDSKRDDSHVLSPPLSVLSLEDGRGPATRHPTLGSELGSDFGDVFTSTPAVAGAGVHFRSSSIFDGFSITSSIPPSPTGSAVHKADAPSVSFPFPPAVVSVAPREEPETPQSQTGASMRMRRLSTTVRARTHRWVDRRLQDAFQPLRLAPEAPEAPLVAPHPALSAIDRVFDAVDAVVGRFAPLVAPTREEPATALSTATSAATVVPAPSAPRAPTRRHKLATVVLELWLWLQFAIIVLVFVYAMAKRGPKSVLKDADAKQRRA
jgi:hypothetical protein